jgi:hypothetical protein
MPPPVGPTGAARPDEGVPATVQPSDVAPHIPIWDVSIGQPGMDAWVYTLSTIGSGPSAVTYAGGYFTRAGTTPANAIARFDGSAWSALGAGINGLVMSIVEFDDGRGPALYAAGLFDAAGGQPMMNIARWDYAAQTWSAVGEGVDGAVIALAVYDSGAGAALYAGGDFQHAGSTPLGRVAKWDGKSWSALGSTANNTVRAMHVMNTPHGAKLYVGGNFNEIGGVSANRIASWDGTKWEALGDGVGTPGIRAMTVFDDGSGPSLAVGGRFSTAAGQPADSLAAWNPATQQWRPLGAGVNERVVALREFDDGGGPRLYAAGWFTVADGRPVRNLIRWNGTTWQAVDMGFDAVSRALAVLDQGAPFHSTLIVGGGFRNVSAGPVRSVVRLLNRGVDPALIPASDPSKMLRDAPDANRMRGGRGAPAGDPDAAPPARSPGRARPTRPTRDPGAPTPPDRDPAPALPTDPPADPPADPMSDFTSAEPRPAPSA